MRHNGVFISLKESQLLRLLVLANAENIFLVQNVLKMEQIVKISQIMTTFAV